MLNTFQFKKTLQAEQPSQYLDEDIPSNNLVLILASFAFKVKCTVNNSNHICLLPPKTIHLYRD